MKYFVKRLKYIVAILFVVILTACSEAEPRINECDMTYNNSFSETAEIMQEETNEPATPEATTSKTNKYPITVDWIETEEEYEAARHKSNGKQEVSVLRVSKSITNEDGAVLANIYYDRPVVSGESEAAEKVNLFLRRRSRNGLMKVDEIHYMMMKII